MKSSKNRLYKVIIRSEDGTCLIFEGLIQEKKQTLRNRISIWGAVNEILFSDHYRLLRGHYDTHKDKYDVSQEIINKDYDLSKINKMDAIKLNTITFKDGKFNLK